MKPMCESSLLLQAVAHLFERNARTARAIFYYLASSESLLAGMLFITSERIGSILLNLTITTCKYIHKIQNTNR